MCERANARGKVQERKSARLAKGPPCVTLIAYIRTRTCTHINTPPPQRFVAPQATQHTLQLLLVQLREGQVFPTILCQIVDGLSAQKKEQTLRYTACTAWLALTYSYTRM